MLSLSYFLMINKKNLFLFQNNLFILNVIRFVSKTVVYNNLIYQYTEKQLKFQNNL